MKRYRVVLDTNVLISAILFSGPPREILELVIRGAVDCSLSPPMLDELRDVLQRPKFGLSLEQAFQVLEELHVVCDVINPSMQIHVVTADPDDNMVLACALESKADLLVSGDQHLLDIGTFRGVQMVTPTDALKTIKRVPRQG
ncbi:MAG: putative toxin-antitoxin system toxin component, PIN family [Kiritimatiellaeota bacterium]|nr:putative toxin-antitoxin system toxin component, PIN family [Kiritimatiellota bacterium]